jgi:hypothetical protein
VGKAIGFGQMAALIKEAIAKHGASNSVTPALASVKVKRITA